MSSWPNLIHIPLSLHEEISLTVEVLWSLQELFTNGWMDDWMDGQRHDIRRPFFFFFFFFKTGI